MADLFEHIGRIFSDPKGLWEDITGTGLQREQFEYQKALQQQIFEREDTAWQRAASDAQKVGINPMALTNGANSGSVVPTSMDTSGNIQGINSFIGALGVTSQILNSINELDNGSKQRDLLQSQIDMQNLQNAITAFKNGVTKNSDGSFSFDKNKQADLEVRNLLSDTERNERVNTYQIQSGLNDTTSQPTHSFVDVVEGVKNNPNSQKLRERLLTWLKDNKDKNNRSWKPSDYFDNSSNKKFNDNLSNIYSNSINQIKKFLNFMNDKKKSKNIKNKHANYYNNMIRNNYINAN